MGWGERINEWMKASPEYLALPEHSGPLTWLQRASWEEGKGRMLILQYPFELDGFRGN